MPNSGVGAIDEIDSHISCNCGAFWHYLIFYANCASVIPARWKIRPNGRKVVAAIIEVVWGKFSALVAWIYQNLPDLLISLWLVAPLIFTLYADGDAPGRSELQSNLHTPQIYKNKRAPHPAANNARWGTWTLNYIVFKTCRLWNKLSQVASDNQKTDITTSSLF